MTSIEKYHALYNQFISLTNLHTVAYTSSEKTLRDSLRRVKAFLAFLGKPEEHMKFIHVTGTSGKGSVTHMLHTILHASHKTVASYTSPHTTTYLERFSYQDGLVPTETLNASMEFVMHAYGDFLKQESPLSFFELSFCLAMHTFASLEVEWCVLEVGCGGRFDATNVIPTPEIAIITNVNKDHVEILGNTLPEIAYEKAGIIKKHSIVFCGELRPKLKSVFKKEAVEQDAALFFIPPPKDPILPEALGNKQQHNAALVYAAAQELQIEHDVIQQALQHIQPLPCRFETMQNNPRVILDGAHSEAKLQFTADQIKKLDGDIHIIYGSGVQKDASLLNILAPYAKTIHTTRYSTTFRKAANPHVLMNAVPKNKRGQVFMYAPDALQTILPTLKKSDILLITGSLYLSGELREHWVSEKQILKTANNRHV